MDRDSLIWSRRLILVGAVLRPLSVTAGSAEYHVKPLGVLLIVAGLLFLIDFRATRKFTMLYWSVLGIWTLSLLREIVAFTPIADSTGYSSSGVGLIITLFELLSVILFCQAMTELTTAHQLKQSTASWRLSTRIAAYVYGIPMILLLLFLGVAFSGYIEGLNFSYQAPPLVGPLFGMLGLVVIAGVVLGQLIQFFQSFALTIRESRKLKSEEHPSVVTT